ncbi:MAG: S53 family peptidase [Pseudonocardiaceae bacterium]
MTKKQWASVPGSERVTPPRARLVGRPEGNLRAEVTVLVRRRSAARPAAAAEAISASAQQRLPRHLTREEFANQHGADPSDLERVAAFAREHGLDVVSRDATRRTVVLGGTLSALASAFGVEFGLYEHEGGHYRGRQGAVRVPAELAQVIEGVFGLDDRPQARPHNRRAQPADASTTPSLQQLTAAQVAKLYAFPVGRGGGGQCVGIIELGGGYREDDLRTYCAELGSPLPKITSVSVAGAASRPTGGQDESADHEVALDIQVATTVAPKANYVVYFAPNTDRGFLDAITTAIHDTEHNPSVLSISWGAAERRWTPQTQQAFDEAFADAALLGVTVCCSTGDQGSSAGENDGLAHTELPATSPHALACGGTHLIVNGGLTVNGGAITDEVVWQDQFGGGTGGGISDVFGPPSWQSAAGVPPSANRGNRVGRGIPDVAGNAHCDVAYRIVVGGQWRSVGGTSAVAPLMAGLVALANQRLGQRVGWLNPLLYQQLAGKRVFRDITSGDNGAYHAGPGWNPCTGLGVPHGSALLDALGALATVERTDG